MPEIIIDVKKLIEKDLSETLDRVLEESKCEIEAISVKANEEYVKVCEDYKKAMLQAKTDEQIEELNKNTLTAIKNSIFNACVESLGIGLKKGFNAALEWRNK